MEQIHKSREAIEVWGSKDVEESMPFEHLKRTNCLFS